MTTPTTATKRCPGYDGLGPLDPKYQAAHDLPADLKSFNSNAGNPDGLSTRCRTCGNSYGTDWAKRSKAIKAADAMPPGIERDQALDAAYALPPIPRARKAERVTSEPAYRADAGEASLAERVEPATVHVAAVADVPTFHDELAVRAKRGKAKGYTAELVGEVWYALPDGSVASTPEGQAALVAVNEARAAERRRRDAERKRAERAAAKQRQVAATA